MSYSLVFLFLVMWSLRSIANSVDYGKKQYILSLNQDLLVEAEKKYEKRTFLFTLKEQVANHYLQYLRWKVLNQTAASATFPPMLPVEKILKEIKSSEIYRLLKAMPKGAILHTHENHQLSKHTLLQLFMSTNLSSTLYVHDGSDASLQWNLEVHRRPPNNPNLVQVLQKADDPRFSIENLAKQQTMIGVMETLGDLPPNDSRQRWALANRVFDRGSTRLVVDENVKRMSLEAMYKQGLSEGIFYFETRKSLSRADRDIRITKDLIEEFKIKHPEFLGHRRVYYSKRTDKPEEIIKDLENVARLMKKYPDHVVGYDLVGDEDWGVTFHHHINHLLKYIKIDSQNNVHINEGNVEIPWLLHTAESNWIENVHMEGVNDGEDIIPRRNNLYTAILLGAKRIGHGIGFWKHPYLMKQLKEKNIPLEICPVSNQILGYTPDLRQHPGQLFYKVGVPIVLSPDDPGLFGYDEVTLDWYETFMGWSGLNMGDLRQFSTNSIRYSGMEEEEKKDAIDRVLNRAWEKYVDSVVQEACSKSFNVPKSSFKKLLPNHGPRTGDTKVHILGFNFEAAMCRKILCLFGEEESGSVTEGMYITNQHLICETPSVTLPSGKTTLKVGVFIAWSDNILSHNGHHHDHSHQKVVTGKDWIDTGLTFTYFDIPELTQTTSGCQQKWRRSNCLLISLLIFLFLMLF